MNSLRIVIGGVCACLVASAQAPVIRPQVAGRAVQEGQVTVVYLAPRFATAIRMPGLGRRARRSRSEYPGFSLPVMLPPMPQR